MGVLLMAMTIGGLIAAGVLLAISVYTKKNWLLNFVFGGVAVWFMFYFAMLVGFSVKSDEKQLVLNESKAFCGFYLDCHMHAAVRDVRKTKTIGNKTAAGEFYVVTVEIFSNAVKATLGLNTVDAHVVDRTNQQYTRDMDAEAQLTPQPAFEKQIGPEESFTKQIVFDLPTDVSNPRLDLRESIGTPDRIVEIFLIGDEESILHKRAYFKLEPVNTNFQVRNN